MEKKSFRQFHRDLSWSTRIYTLLTVCLIIGAFVFNAWETNWALTMVAAIAVILFVESFALSMQNHPKTWQAIRWILFLILLALLLTSLLS